jgi:hypothetical protein
MFKTKFDLLIMGFFMVDAERLVSEIAERINGLQGGISRQPWRNASRGAFARALEDGVSELKELEGLFKDAARQIEKDPKEGSPDLKPFLKELGKVLDVLEKNLGFEKGKKSRAGTVSDLDREEIPDLYADLEQQILGILLKARYSLERATIFFRKQGLTPLTGKGTARQVMQVLDRKEDELQALREKYEDIRKKSYLGYVEEESVADTEHDLGELSRRMALSADELSKSISFHRSQIEYIENSYAELKQKLDTLEEIFFAYSEKSSELIKNLKKERDYAKRIVLDVEHETLQLRNTYSRELLSLQESKLAFKAEAEKNFLKKVKELQKKLGEQEDLTKHFRKIAEEKLKKEHALEEKVKRITLLLKTKEKHDAVKKALAKKTRKKTSRKKKN